MTAGAVFYDFIALTNDPNAEYSQSEVRADVTPTVFYRRKNGRLVELVDAYVRFEQPVPEGLAVLTAQGSSYSANLSVRDSFGEQRIEFEVPEWQGSVPATLKVTAGVQHTFPLSLMAERKWTVYVVPHTHVDVGYTDYQGKVAENQATTLTEAAALIKEHPDFRFATDGSWNLRQLLETRSEPEQNEILNLIRTDKIGVPADYFNLLTGYASLETLYRSLYYTKSLSLKFGTRTGLLYWRTNNGMRNRPFGGKVRTERRFCSGTAGVICKYGDSSRWNLPTPRSMRPCRSFSLPMTSRNTNRMPY